MIKEVFWTEIQHEKKRDFSWSRSLFLSCIPCYYKKRGKRGEESSWRFLLFQQG